LLTFMILIIDLFALNLVLYITDDNDPSPTKCLIN